MEKLRLLILPAMCVLAVLSACAEYPDPSAACNDLPIGRAPRHDQGVGHRPIRIYQRDSASEPFTESDLMPLNDSLFANLSNADDSEIALVACVTVTPTEKAMTCGFGRSNQAAVSSGIAPDPTVAAMLAADTTVTVDYYSAHYEVSLRSVRTGDEIFHESFDIASDIVSCPFVFAVSDDQTTIIRTPHIADYQPFYDNVTPYALPAP